ncbi:Hypothetical_protein [Hexamita inflata]|uniref:Hypothetical_protein n=1 Tax=Hexamita inflata TaxID=28002 RepID=A0AA86Q955_9EUKA|nr:Hypothetical protein HINF_LOCUS42260 [Hexamita inflata]
MCLFQHLKHVKGIHFTVFSTSRSRSPSKLSHAISNNKQDHANIEVSRVHASKYDNICASWPSHLLQPQNIVPQRFLIIKLTLIQEIETHHLKLPSLQTLKLARPAHLVKLERKPNILARKLLYINNRPLQCYKMNHFKE